jgi:hypothetical protein
MHHPPKGCGVAQSYIRHAPHLRTATQLLQVQALQASSSQQAAEQQVSELAAQVAHISSELAGRAPEGVSEEQLAAVQREWQARLEERLQQVQEFSVDRAELEAKVGEAHNSLASELQLPAHRPLCTLCVGACEGSMVCRHHHISCNLLRLNCIPWL